MADGIVIQNAATRLLAACPPPAFEQLRDIRRDVHILILMGYLNPIRAVSAEAFCQKCVECGIDEAIVPDLLSAITEGSYRPSPRSMTSDIMLITRKPSEAASAEIDAHTDKPSIWCQCRHHRRRRLLNTRKQAASKR